MAALAVFCARVSAAIRRLPSMTESEDFDRVLDVIMLCGLLIEAHPVLPSVAALIIDESVGDAWREHADREAVDAVLTRLAEHEDVLGVPLISERVTWIHRQLWPALLAVVSVPEPWQTNRLSADVVMLYARVDEDGVVDRDEADDAVTRELHDRLLAHVGPERIMSWERWCRSRHSPRPDVSPPARRRLVEATGRAVCRGFHCGAVLPWSRDHGFS
jgi:hypothetical protein